MKNKSRLQRISLALVAAFSLLFTGCQNDDDNNVSRPVEKKITFNLKISTHQLTRSTPGTGNENGNSNDFLAFYQFNKDGKYEQRYLSSCRQLGHRTALRADISRNFDR